jgi:hypothetical protein
MYCANGKYNQVTNIVKRTSFRRMIRNVNLPVFLLNVTTLIVNEIFDNT